MASGTYYPVWITTDDLTIVGVDTGGGKPVIDIGDTEQAIRIRGANGVRIDGFRFEGENNQGIHFESGSDDAVITNNTFAVELGFVFAPESTNHVIYANDFSGTNKVIADYQNAMQDITVHWNATEPVTYWWNGKQRSAPLGNFYTDTADDDDGDGIAETVHEQNKYPWKNKDYHPLVGEPWKYFEKGVGTSNTQSKT